MGFWRGFSDEDFSASGIAPCGWPLSHRPYLHRLQLADRRIDVTVLDEQGLPLVGARVTATLRAGNLSRTASQLERAVLDDRAAPGVYTLRVSASGFQMQDGRRSMSRPSRSRPSKCGCGPAGYTEQLVVTATRSEQRIADVPASINLVTNEQIEQSPAVVADDVLRQIPTFSLFRRTSSLAANPTAQGVSLRGIGPSGVSRTLVLLDDIPFNDPFGGWVYWTRVPMMNAERIEIIDGATSSLYGNYAMGGVINIVTNRPTPRTRDFQAAVRQPCDAQDGSVCQRRVGQARCHVRRHDAADRRLHDRGGRRARLDRQRSQRPVSERQRESSTTTRPIA